MKIIWRSSGDSNVVASVAEQTAAAADLAGIDGQDRLTDPRTNPAVRALADQLRNEQHRRALDSEHSRKLRRHRVFDRRAAHAEHALEALQAAREASSAARSVLALHKGRDRFMGASLAASLVLSVGSAMGVAAFARDLHAPSAVGYIAEVGMVGMSTMVITYRSHLAQHGGKATGWHATVLWLLMIGPLAASMLANLFGAGPVGIACSVGAAAFSLLSYVIADTSAEALLAQAEQVTGADEADLRAIANGDDLFTIPTADPAKSPSQVTPEAMNQASDPATPQVTPESVTQATQDEVTQGAPQVTSQVTNEAAHGSVTQATTQVTSEPLAQATDRVTPEVTPQVTSEATPQTTRRAPRKPRGKAPNKSRRTDAELIAELNGIVADHYREHPGQEINVKPVATQLGIGRDRCRRLLDQMSVRPIRKVGT